MLFPYVKDAPSLTPAPSIKATPSTGSQSLRSAKPSWHRAARPGANQENKQRLFVFVAGGMTYSEMREAYLLSKSLNKEIIIGLSSISFTTQLKSHCTTGSTHAIAPKDFIDDLKVVEIGGVGSRAMPNGPPEWRGQRPFQEFYDELYYTRDAPPPQQRAPAAATTRPQPGRSAQSAPTPSYASSGSVNIGMGPNGEKEKKKKKGFLRF